MNLPIGEIICGDCLDVMRGWPDGCVDMIFTDPPYGHNNNNGDLIQRREAALGHPPSSRNPAQGEARPIMNDGAEAGEIFRACLPEFKRLLGNDGCCCCCCCCGGGPDPRFARWSLWLDEVLTFKQMVIWDKGPMGMGWHYRRSYETVLVAHKGQKCRWYDTTDKVENVVRHIPKIIPSASQHPTEKPWQLAAHFIALHTKPGDLVLDPFCGSGSTLDACTRLGRRYIGIDLDPHWCEIARKRTAQRGLFVEVQVA